MHWYRRKSQALVSYLPNILEEGCDSKILRYLRVAPHNEHVPNQNDVVPGKRGSVVDMMWHEVVVGSGLNRSH